MWNMHKYPWLRHACRVFCTGVFLFMAGSGNALAYGSYGIGHGYHHGHHGGHYGVHASYSSHGHDNTAGYVILGLFGAVLLSHLLHQEEYRYRGTYRRSSPYQPTGTYNKPAPQVSQVSRGLVYAYSEMEGWDKLTAGNTRHALDIFAVQSQQNLDSGLPRVGFALAAAAEGDLDRGTRAMRKAVSIDPYALNAIPDNEELGPTIDLLSEQYGTSLADRDSDPDNSFMVATLAYLNQDYVTAGDALADNDHSRSADNLRKLIVNAE